MANTKTENTALSRREQGVLLASIVIMVGTIPFTYVFFLLPLLALPVALLAGLVVAGIIRNPIAVRVIEFLSILGALIAIWLMIILLNYLSK